MKKAMNVLYAVKNGLYVNLTNRCPCSCVFCLRQKGDGVYGSDSLWLEREPETDFVIDQLEKIDLDKYDEVVFCGYGEPTERLYDLLRIAEYVKSRSNIKIRVNTNGLSDLIYSVDTAPLFIGKVDELSISLNATDAETYLRLTRSKFGLKSFDSLVNFAKRCKESGLSVVMTIVDTVTTESEQAKAKKIADEAGVRLRIRPLE